MPQTVLRQPDDHRVGFVELFFDLVFVFAVTQVSHLLLYHYDMKGGMQAALIFLAIWWVWIFTTWVLNRLNPDQGAVRALLFLMMALGLFMSMAIPKAFEDRGWVFGLAFAAMQVGRTGFVVVVSWRNPVLRLTYLRILTWLSVAGLFWILGGFAKPEHRMAFWAVAVAIEYLGPLTAMWLPGLGRDKTTNWTISGAHMAERCGLFVIICLGETLLVSGATFSAVDWDGAGLLAFLAALSGTVGMWWVYFHIGHRRGSHQIEHSDDPGRLARLAFTYAHIPIVAGIVLGAVSSERAIAHPLDRAVLSECLSAIGGVILFILGNGWFKAISGRWFPFSHLVGLGLCLVMFALSPWSNLLLLNVGAALVLLCVAVLEHRSIGKQMLVEVAK